MEPLSPQRKWRAITLASLLLAPACWSMLAGFVALADDDGGGVGNPGAAIAFGIALLPFVFIVLAFLSEQTNPARAVLRAMGLCLLVGIIVSALAADAVSGLVAGVGAGGIVGLRADDAHTWRTRAIGVAVAAVYAFVLARTAGGIVLLAAPVFPFTAIGVADHLAERRLSRVST
ncbi:MAG TPA: hypothetical protein VFU93_07115 [Acidimicrobiales bacterium]|nr:hypothetical protein [Acidimicrobiales bacterium]